MNQQLLSDIGLGIFFILSIIYIVAYIFTKGQPLSKLQKYTKKKRTLNTVIPTFIDSLNRGDNIWAEYLSDTAQITSDLNAPYYVGKIIDFIDYAQQVDSQFTITKLNRKKSIITCTIVESNKWITNITSPSPKSQSSINHKFIFQMKTKQLIENIHISLEPDDYTRGFLYSLKDWMLANDLVQAKSLYTQNSQLICTGQNGAEIVQISQVFMNAMIKLIALNSNAKKAMRKNNYTTAVMIYTDMLNLKPDRDIQYSILLGRAYAYVKMEEHINAIEDYKTVVAMTHFNPDPNVIWLLCVAFITIQQPEQSLPYCNQLVALSPCNDTHDIRGIVYGMLGNYEAAISDFESSSGSIQNTVNNLPITQENRDNWVTQMKNEQNPFTSVTINELFGTVIPDSDEVS